MDGWMGWMGWAGWVGEFRLLFHFFNAALDLFLPLPLQQQCKYYELQSVYINHY